MSHRTLSPVSHALRTEVDFGVLREGNCGLDVLLRSTFITWSLFEPIVELFDFVDGLVALEDLVVLVVKV